MYLVTYYNFGEEYTIELSETAAIDELLHFGVPYTRKELESFTRAQIWNLLNEIYP